MRYPKEQRLDKFDYFLKFEDLQLLVHGSWRRQEVKSRV